MLWSSRNLTAIPPLAFFGAFGWLGVLGGHVLTYRLLDMQTDDAAGTHAWLHWAGAWSPLLLVLATLTAIIFTARSSHEMSRWLGARSRAVRMRHGACAAAGVYAAIEICERLVTHEAPPRVAELATGMALQAVIAALVVMLVWSLARLTLAIVERIHAALERRRAPADRAPRLHRSKHDFSFDMRRQLAISGSLVGRAPPTPA